MKGSAGWSRYAVVVGGTTRAALREALRSCGVRTNAYFDALWPQVAVADAPRALEIVVATAAALGLPDGATLDALVDHVAALGLGPCPLEAAARLRLVLHEPPGGRITVVSPRPTADEAAPRGVYLRTDREGEWLRAFVASDDWRFEADERFALAVCARAGAPRGPGGG